MNIENTFFLEDIVRVTKGVLLNGDMGAKFKGISTDSRIIPPGYLFWALKGLKYDGHDFWKEAVQRGAKGLVISRIPKDLRIEELPKTIALVLVKDTLYALQEFAHFWRKELNCIVVGITGSCGKTTTKELVYEILSKYFKTAKNEANYNNLIGTPLSLLSMKKGIEVAVLEIGTSFPGEIEKLAKIISPQVSVITSIYPAHLEGLSSIEGILEEKIKIFEHTDPQGTIVYFYDQEMLRKRANAFPHKKISFGFEEGATIRGRILQQNLESLKGEIYFKENKLLFELPNIGKHNVLNLLSALAVALSLGLEIDEIIKKINNREISIYSRAKKFEKSNVLILDDTYNANPGSMRAAFEYLKSLKEYPTKILILGDMKELGTHSERYHVEIGDLAKEVADIGYFIGDFAESYGKGFSPNFYKTFKSVEEFLEKFSEEELLEILKKKRAVVLVKGSRALKMERIVDKLLKEL